MRNLRDFSWEIVDCNIDIFIFACTIRADTKHAVTLLYGMLQGLLGWWRGAS